MRSLRFAAPLVFASALLHCSTGSTSGFIDGSDAAVRNPNCPNTEPQVGAPCALASSITCTNYPSAATPGCYCCGGGGSAGYQCVGGKWSRLPSAGGAPTVIGTCPDTVPKNGDACGPECGGARLSCSYDCAHGNGYVSSATCSGGSWQVSQSLVACEGADAGTDADAADGDGG